MAPQFHISRQDIPRWVHSSVDPDIAGGGNGEHEQEEDEEESLKVVGGDTLYAKQDGTQQLALQINIGKKQMNNKTENKQNEKNTAKQLQGKEHQNKYKKSE